MVLLGKVYGLRELCSLILLEHVTHNSQAGYDVTENAHCRCSALIMVYLFTSPSLMAPYVRKVCAIFGCDFIPGDENHYYHFPKDVNLRNIWIHACRRSDTVNPKTASICSRHFSSSQLKRDLKFELLNVVPPRNY